MRYCSLLKIGQSNEITLVIADVCCGSKAALTAPKSNFRFTPESGLKTDIAPCPKSANCRHKSSSCPSNHRTRPSEQSHRELGAIAKFAVDRDEPKRAHLG